MTRNPSDVWRGYGRVAMLVLTVLFAVGVAGHAVESTFPLMMFLTPGFLVLTSVLVVAPALAADRWRFTAWLAGTYGFTFAAEAAGVATGAVFGEYVYGPTLGWAWLGVPLVIAFNWAVVVHGCVALAGWLVPAGTGLIRTSAVSLLAGGGAVAFDWVMEPLAIRLDYWTWAGGDIPLQNYAAWFVIAAVVAPFHPRVRRGDREMGTAESLAVFFVAAQVVFFILLRRVLAS